MGFVFIGLVLVVLIVVTAFWQRREDARISEILRSGAAGEMHDVNVQGKIDPSLAGIVDAGPPSGHAGKFYGTN